MEIKQGEAPVLSLQHYVDGAPIQGVVAAQYAIFGSNKQQLLVKTLGSGISFVDGRINIQFTVADTVSLPSGIHKHECVIRDQHGITTYPIDNESIKVKPTDLRLP